MISPSKQCGPIRLYQSNFIQADISIPEVCIVEVHAVDVGQPSSRAFVTIKGAKGDVKAVPSAQGTAWQ